MHAEELRSQARDVLLGFVHPLVGGCASYCIAFPFPATVFEPQALMMSQRDHLDMEDIGALLCHSRQPRRRQSGRSSHRNEQLDPMQRAAVEHAGGAARVLAPAGAGKTRTLISRVQELVARGVAPGRILLLAFNRQAAEQLEQRLESLGIRTTRRLLGTCAASAVHCATFNAFGLRYQHEVAGRRLAIEGDESTRRALMARALAAAGLELSAVKPQPCTDPVGQLLSALAEVRAGLRPPGDIEVHLETSAGPPFITSFEPVHSAYQKLQTAQGCQSFDDQVYFAIADMLADPVHRSYIQGRYEHILVDEFQDLNPAQLTLVDLLSRPRRDLFVVGDDDQLIYGWRFADPRGLLEFHERMPRPPGSASYTLGTNYRCSTSIVSSAARLISNNAVRAEKQVLARDGAQPGAMLFVGAQTWPERGSDICTFLKAERQRLSCSWRDLAILTRYRSQRLAALLTLNAGGIPCSMLLAHQTLAHPFASTLRAFIESVTPDVGDSWPGICPDDQQRYSFQTARELLDCVVERLGVERLLVDERATAAPGERAPLRDATADDQHAMVSPSQVLDALSLLAQLHPSPDALIATWDELARRSLRDEAEDGVVVCTIHAAKGREYQSVVIPDYDCDVTRWNRAEIEEERRVVYVGVTRARDSVLMTVDTSLPYVHPFLRELVEPPGAGEHASLVARLQREEDLAALPSLKKRLNDIEVLFPDHLSDDGARS
jgi:DNA helicase-2/ATP-dependent DNA helicase PcrA